MRIRRRYCPDARTAITLLVLACTPLAGCGPKAYSRMWADTALPGGKFSIMQHQWAYDGEPVTFELETDPGAVNFVVFGIDGHETVIPSGDVAGRYRWTRTFHAGLKPQVQEVYAQPFLMRGKCDWVYDKTKDAWFFYPGVNERADVPSAKEQTIRVTCYRMEMRIGFQPRGGPPKRVELTLTKMTGEQVTIPRRPESSPDARGFLLVGPGKDGAYEVVCTPKYSDISRAERTRAQLVVAHADGSVERIVKDFDTP